MMVEFRTLKTVLEVPRLRSELKSVDFKGKNFEEFLKIMDGLATDVAGQLQEAGLSLGQGLSNLIDESPIVDFEHVAASVDSPGRNIGS